MLRRMANAEAMASTVAYAQQEPEGVRGGRGVVKSERESYFASHERCMPRCRRLYDSKKKS